MSTCSSAVVIVSPFGGVRLLRELFRSLQGTFPGTIVILSHAGTGRERGVADNLNVASAVMVHPGTNGVRLRDGHAYVAPADARLSIGADGRLTRADGAEANDDDLPLGNGGSSFPDSRGEPLLSSLAARFGVRALAVALTALDGSEREGFAQVRAAGGATFALDEADRLWADASGPRVVPDLADELLTMPELGPRMNLAARHTAILR